MFLDYLTDVDRFRGYALTGHRWLRMAAVDEAGSGRTATTSSFL